MSIIQEALCETCFVATSTGNINGAYMLDVDESHAMFKRKNIITILRLEDILALEFKDDEGKNREHIRDEDTQETTREADL